MRIALVPGVLALLPSYAGLVDPVADLRAACERAVAWLGDEVTVLADPQGCRVAHSLVEERRSASDDASRNQEPSIIVVGNGSACRSDKAPGHLDPRAAEYDDELSAWLRGHGARPPLELGRELLASVEGFAQLDERLTWGEPVVDLEADPFGVQYWVMRWELP